jgi:ribosomal protein S18 acetylase RimI-like enzyme
MMSLPSIPLTSPFRLAIPDDAPALIDFIDYAASGRSETAPAIAVPWQELTNLALGTWHIGAIALYPGYRGQGWGTRLMRIADELRQASGASRSSLLVADANRARRLYERFGFREEARRPVVTGNWQNPGKDWLLLIRG